MMHVTKLTLVSLFALSLAVVTSGCGGEASKAKRSPRSSESAAAKTAPAAAKEAPKTPATTTAATKMADTSKTAGGAGPAKGDWGTLKGKFVYNGTAPKPEKINITKDQEVCGKHDLVNESLLVGDDGGIANVVIYVRTKGVKANPDLTKDNSPVKIDNKDCRFDPHVTVYQVSRPLLLHNSDPISHNMNLTMPGDASTNQLLQPDSGVEHQLKNARPVGAPIACNIHPWMSGWLLPRDNPYFAVSDKDGSFEIEGLPAGELEFQVWHEKAGYVAAPGWERGRFSMTIKPGDNQLGEGGVVKLDPQLFNK